MALQLVDRTVLEDMGPPTVEFDARSELPTDPTALSWRLADLGAKHSMLLAGLGWGNMPSHQVQNDLEQGRLKAIRPMKFDSRAAQLPMCGAYLADHRLGSAGQWMIEHLSAVVGS